MGFVLLILAIVFIAVLVSGRDGDKSTREQEKRGAVDLKDVNDKLDSLLARMDYIMKRLDQLTVESSAKVDIVRPHAEPKTETAEQALPYEPAMTMLLSVNLPQVSMKTSTVDTERQTERKTPTAEQLKPAQHVTADLAQAPIPAVEAPKTQQPAKAAALASVAQRYECRCPEPERHHESL